MKKGVKIFSFAFCQAVLLALVGLLFGLIYSFGGLIYDIISVGTLNWGTIWAFLAVIGMPIIFGLTGFLLGIIEAILLNLCFRWLGRFNLNPDKEEWI